MSEAGEGLDKIIIPKRFVQSSTRLSSDIEIPVIPVTESWLISTERTWEEVDQYLEDRLVAISVSFTNIDTPTSLAPEYGVQKPVESNQARFLAYAELADEYRVAIDFYSARAKQERDKCDQDVREIRERARKDRLSKGDTDRLIREKQKAYEGVITTFANKVDIAEQVLKLVYRKASTDFFSTANKEDMSQVIIICGFPETLEKANADFSNSSGTDSFRERKPLDYFVDGLASYLSDTKDKSLFIRYRYRYSTALVTKTEDELVLGNSLGLVCGQRGDKPDPRLKNLGMAYFRFLRTRASYLSKANLNGDEFPHLALIYDLYDTAAYHGGVEMMNLASGVINTLYGPLVPSNEITNEMKRCAAKTAAEAKRAAAQLVEQGGNPEEITSMKLPEVVWDFYSGANWRLVEGLFELTFIDEGLKIPFRVSRPAARIGSDTWNSTVKELYGEKSAQAVILAHPNINLETYFPRNGITADLGVGVNRVAQDVSLFVAGDLDTHDKLQEFDKSTLAPDLTTQDKIQKLKVVLDQEAHLADGDRETYLRELTNLYLRLFFRYEERGSAEVAKENLFLWGKILDESRWFISPRGDRFSLENDPGLEEYGLQSITFNIDRSKPREHMVTIKLIDSDKSIVFWLNTKKELVDAKGTPIAFDPNLKDKFTNVLLKRLYVITMGKLSKEAGIVEEKADDEEKPGETFRRAHYHVFRAGDERITMQSKTALDHARLIKELYGIDIYQEIKRRRELKILQQNQFMTFERESTPLHMSLLVLPNDLKFDPLLVDLPK